MSDPGSIIELLATWKLADDTDNIFEDAADWALPFLVKNALEPIRNVLCTPLLTSL